MLFEPPVYQVEPMVVDCEKHLKSAKNEKLRGDEKIIFLKQERLLSPIHYLI